MVVVRLVLSCLLLVVTVQGAQAQEVLQTEDSEEANVEVNLTEFNEQSTTAVTHPADTEEGASQEANLAEFSEESLAAGPGAVEAEALDTGVDLAEFGAQSAAIGPITEDDPVDAIPNGGSNKLFLPFIQAITGSLNDTGKTENLSAASADEAADSPAAPQSVQADFNRDGYDDLAIGVPYEDLGTLTNAGAVNVIYGGVGGLGSAGNQVWSQDSFGILGVAEAGDLFGLALTSCDCNNDGYDDLAIGVPYEDLGTLTNAGAVNVLYGGVGGLGSAGNQVWTQDNSNILGVAEAGDLFGYSLTCCDFNNNLSTELNEHGQECGFMCIELNCGLFFLKGVGE